MNIELTNLQENDVVMKVLVENLQDQKDALQYEKDYNLEDDLKAAHKKNIKMLKKAISYFESV